LEALLFIISKGRTVGCEVLFTIGRDVIGIDGDTLSPSQRANHHPRTVTSVNPLLGVEGRDVVSLDSVVMLKSGVKVEFSQAVELKSGVKVEFSEAVELKSGEKVEFSLSLKIWSVVKRCTKVEEAVSSLKGASLV
jgi:hypothetical protein